MKLAIVGSVSLAGNKIAYKVIYDSIAKWQPTLIISGGAKGIDSMAIEAAKTLNIPYIEYKPEYQAWPAFKVRNLKIAQECDALIRIVSATSKTYGSGWTRDRAKEMGKPTEEYLILDTLM